MASAIHPGPLIVATGVLLTSGLVHGLWTNRWQASSALDDACARLRAVPMRAGAWQGANVEVDPEQYRQARAVSYWLRHYTHNESSASMTVILMCGQAGHMAVHTPDICYRGAGFEVAHQPEKKVFAAGAGGSQAEFWTARFRQGTKAAGPELRIYWAWGCRGTWNAPDSPRWSLGGEPYLYKLYVVHETNSSAIAAELPEEFIKELIPVLEKSLFSYTQPQP
jgi:hypothetical protein